VIYRRISVQVWSDEIFRELSHLGKLSFLFVLTHPHQTSLGAMRATIVGLARELGVPEEAFREGFDKGLLEVDEEASLIVAPKFIIHNPPGSPNVVRSWTKIDQTLPDCELKRKHYQRVKALVEGLGEAFAKALPKAFTKVFANRARDLELHLELDLNKPSPDPERARARDHPPQTPVTTPPAPAPGPDPTNTDLAVQYREPDRTGTGTGPDSEHPDLDPATLAFMQGTPTATHTPEDPDPDPDPAAHDPERAGEVLRRLAAAMAAATPLAERIQSLTREPRWRPWWDKVLLELGQLDVDQDPIGEMAGWVHIAEDCQSPAIRAAKGLGALRDPGGYLGEKARDIYKRHNLKWPDFPD